MQKFCKFCRKFAKSMPCLNVTPSSFFNSLQLKREVNRAGELSIINPSTKIYQKILPPCSTVRGRRMAIVVNWQGGGSERRGVSGGMAKVNGGTWGK